MNIIAFDTASDIFAVGLSVGVSSLISIREANMEEEQVQSYYLEINGGKRHSELIMDSADTLLHLANIQKNNIHAVACMQGPGSFTGLRIGFSAAKGLALALGIPLITVPTLDCMAISFSFWSGIVLPVMDAKKNTFFTALFHKRERLSDYLDIGIEQLVLLIKETETALKKASDTAYDDPGNYGCHGNYGCRALLITGPAAHLAFPALSSAFPKAALDPAFRRSHTAELLLFAAKKYILNIGNKSANEEYRSLLDLGPMYLRKSDAELHNCH